MKSLLLQPTPMAQWKNLVQEAKCSSQLTLNEELESYLVLLLDRFNRRPEIANCVLASEFLLGMHTTPTRKPACLREVGDKCLLLAGLFPEQAEKKMVKLKYFIELGRTAYTQVAGSSKTQAAMLYHALSHSFVRLMEILNTIRGMSDPINELTPLQAIELWTESNSQHALTVLQRRTTSLVLRGPSKKQ